ncbi:MAG: Fe-S cluster assembly protein SufD [Pseudanabaenaceae cyanobacterium bins.68]|nr:Fe-S cluster assembly protein SufD [Pseudanabaenaceae cyanobacterium bins.68]
MTIDRLTGANFATELLRQRFTDDPRSQTGWLGKYQQFYREQIGQIPFPTLRQEEWKYTDLAELLATAWQMGAIAQNPRIEALVQAERIEGTLQLVVVNGVFAPHYSTIALPEGISFSHSSNLSQTNLEQYFQAIPNSDFFTSLNHGCFEDVIVLEVSAEVQQPVQVLFVHDTLDQAAIAHNRLLVVLTDHSSLNLVQTQVGLPDQTYFANTVSQFYLGKNARLHHVLVQTQAPLAYDLHASQIVQASDSHYHGVAIALGAKLSRLQLEIDQKGKGASSQIYGLAVTDGDRLADTHSVIAHQVRDGSSTQVHRTVVSDRGRGVFSGKIKVAKNAQNTNSSQLSRNLLRSSTARVDTQPQLEILADNVKCAHGATVSQLDPEEIFYLQSRGLSASQAANLLTYGFAAEILAQIKLDSLRSRLEKLTAQPNSDRQNDQDQ